MKYVVRLNQKAYNPLTKKVMAERLWEVEQQPMAYIGGFGEKDKEKTVWHCAEVRINGESVTQLFRLPVKGGAPWEHTCYGVAIRGADDAIEIHTGPMDASGN